MLLRLLCAGTLTVFAAGATVGSQSAPQQTNISVSQDRFFTSDLLLVNRVREARRQGKTELEISIFGSHEVTTARPLETQVREHSVLLVRRDAAFPQAVAGEYHVYTWHSFDILKRLRTDAKKAESCSVPRPT